MALLNDLTLPQIFSRLLAFLVVIGIHGFALAGFLRLLGEPTPAYNGRMTPNPVAHLSMLALVMAILFQTFWIVPMTLKSQSLRWGRWSLVVAAIGALLVTFLTVPLLQLLRPLVAVSLPQTGATTTLYVIDTVQQMSLWFIALNWLPWPMLTGALLALAAFPRLARPYHRYRNIALALLIGVIVAGGATPVLTPIHNTLERLVPTWSGVAALGDVQTKV